MANQWKAANEGRSPICKMNNSNTTRADPDNVHVRDDGEGEDIVRKREELSARGQIIAHFLVQRR